jgi:hypothetical protein
MEKDLLKRSYTAAALAAAGITAAIFIYAVVVEVLRRGGFKPPLAPPASYAVKYGLYIMAVGTLRLLKVAGRLDVKKPGPVETVRILVLLALIRAALAEVPAICGLILFILTGAYADFYLLLAFAAGLELYYFPRLGAWEERIRGDFGLI